MTSDQPMPHPHDAKTIRSVCCAVLTVSDSRNEQNDVSGKLIAESLSEAGHKVNERRIIPDEPEQVTSMIREWISNGCVQAVLTNGGTGIAPRDNTYEAVTALFDKQLDGFGELFRTLSYEEIGPKAMLSRATAGTITSGPRPIAVFTLPGSPNACRLAMDKLILPVLPHLTWLTSEPQA
jgi:molybdenum cofactor biosynthesis protein B